MQGEKKRRLIDLSVWLSPEEENHPLPTSPQPMSMAAIHSHSLICTCTNESCPSRQAKRFPLLLLTGLTSVHVITQASKQADKKA